MRVLATGLGGGEREITPDEADMIIDMFASDPYCVNRYDVQRTWEPCWFIVSVHVKGDPWSVVSFMAPVLD